MKKSIVSLLLLVIGIILSACSNSKNEQTSGSSFSKKQECAAYKTRIESELKDRYFLNTKTGYEMEFTLDKLFYSPKVDSCLYVATETDYNTFDNSLNSFLSQDPCLVDALTGEVIVCELREADSDDFYNKKDDFESRVAEYE